MKKQKNSVNKVSFGLVPLGDRIIVREKKTSDGKKTDSGIYIPDSVKEEKEAKRAVVVAVGPGKIDHGKHVPIDIAIGDTVLFQWGEPVTFDGEEYYILKESEISAKILG